MPIDARIPLAGKDPVQFDPISEATKIINWQDLREQREENKLKRALTLKSYADQQEINKILASTNGDLEEAVPQVMQINPKLGVEMQKIAVEQRKSKADMMKTELDVTSKQLDNGISMVQGISDQATFDSVLPELRRTSPEVARILGSAYDQSKVQSVMDMGMSAKEMNDKRRQALEEFTNGKQLKAIGQILSTARSQEEWNAGIDVAMQLKADPAIVKQFGQTWSPEAAKRASELSMTPEERIQAADRASTNKLGWANLQQRIAEHQLTLDDVANMSPEAVRVVATMFAQTGTMPPLGQGKAAAALRTKIFNEAVRLFPDANPALSKALYDADKRTYASLTTQAANQAAFEATALKNLDVMITQARKIKDTGVPWLNKRVRDLDDKILGSGDMAAFEAARRTVIPEFAKLLQGGGLGGVLSDSARHEVEDIMSGSATLEQILRTAEILRADARNRREGTAGELNEVRGRIAAGPMGAPSASPAKPGQPPPAAPKGEVIRGGEIPDAAKKALKDKPAGAYIQQISTGKYYQVQRDGTIAEVK